MYAVTGSAAEYAEPTVVNSSAVRLYLFEECEVENEGGGWRLFWYNDGSDAGCIVAQMWGWSGEYGYPEPLTMSEHDVFTEEQLQTLWDSEEEVIPAPFGVRHRLLTEAEFEGLEWNDIANSMHLGTVTRKLWDVWINRLTS